MGKKRDESSGIEYKLANEVYDFLSQKQPETYFIKEGNYPNGENNSIRYVGVYRRLYGEASVNFFGRNLRLPVTLELGKDPVFAVEISEDLVSRAFKESTDQRYYYLSDGDLPPHIIDGLSALNLKRTSKDKASYYRLKKNER